MRIGGHDAVAVMSAEGADRFAPEKPTVPFVQFMESLHLGGLNVDRESDRGSGYRTLVGWLLDGNVVIALSIRKVRFGDELGENCDEETFFISVLTIGENDKASITFPTITDRPRYSGGGDASAERVTDRVLSLRDDIVGRWGRVSGEMKRRCGHFPGVRHNGGGVFDRT